MMIEKVKNQLDMNLAFFQDVFLKLDSLATQCKVFLEQGLTKQFAQNLSAAHGYLVTLIKKYTNNEATIIAVDTAPVWRELDQIQPILTEKLQELNLKISLIQWRDLSDMQRFVLLKLCRPGHENKNFPKAMVEFGLS